MSLEGVGKAKEMKIETGSGRMYKMLFGKHHMRNLGIS